MSQGPAREVQQEHLAALENYVLRPVPDSQDGEDGTAFRYGRAVSYGHDQEADSEVF